MLRKFLLSIMVLGFSVGASAETAAQFITATSGGQTGHYVNFNSATGVTTVLVVEPAPDGDGTVTRDAKFNSSDVKISDLPKNEDFQTYLQNNNLVVGMGMGGALGQACFGIAGCANALQAYGSQ